MLIKIEIEKKYQQQQHLVHMKHKCCSKQLLYMYQGNIHSQLVQWFAFDVCVIGLFRHTYTLYITTSAIDGIT